MTLTQNQLRTLASLFSRSEANHLLKGNFKSIDEKLKSHPLFETIAGNSYLNALKKIYYILQVQYPNEYIFKNEFLNNWLIKELNKNPSLVFNELRIGKVIADLAFFNHESTAFEIKTILDSKYRLNNQIEEYKKIFNKVYIIAPSQLLSTYLSFDTSTGVIAYNTEDSSFTLEREAQRLNDINPHVLMEFLHTKEYLKITKDYYGDLPDINAFTQFDVCKDLIFKIPVGELNSYFVSIMKQRKIHNQFSFDENIEFNQICLALNLKEQERERLIHNLKSTTF